MRRYERDAQGAGWHDGLLMDLVADDLPRTDAPRTSPAAPARSTSGGSTTGPDGDARGNGTQ